MNIHSLGGKSSGIPILRADAVPSSSSVITGNLIFEQPSIVYQDLDMSV